MPVCLGRRHTCDAGFLIPERHGRARHHRRLLVADDAFDLPVATLCVHRRGRNRQREHDCEQPGSVSD